MCSRAPRTTRVSCEARRARAEVTVTSPSYVCALTHLDESHGGGRAVRFVVTTTRRPPHAGPGREAGFGTVEGRVWDRLRPQSDAKPVSRLRGRTGSPSGQALTDLAGEPSPEAPPTCPNAHTTSMTHTHAVVRRAGAGYALGLCRPPRRARGGTEAERTTWADESTRAARPLPGLEDQNRAQGSEVRSGISCAIGDQQLLVLDRLSDPRAHT